MTILIFNLFTTGIRRLKCKAIHSAHLVKYTQFPGTDMYSVISDATAAGYFYSHFIGLLL